MSEPSSVANVCPKCGAVLPVAATAGLCPRCLMAEAMAPTKPDAGAAAPRKPLSPLELAPHFPQLEILEYLGRGGMGVVYKARQKNLNRFVALKLLAPERVGDPKFAERFTHEARALAALNHPNIVTVYDFGQAGGFYYLLMEFVDGVNLRQAMKAARFTPEQALAIVPPVCEALQYAHEHGIVHRDIKPENLLLDKEGRVKIADFGIAKMLHAGDSDVGVADSQPVGTPQYMAPEQKARCVTDHRADIYSLGVVLYELLTGELPGRPIEPPSRKVQIDVRLDEIVLRALEKEPERRYQQVSEVKTMVETVTASQSSRGASAAPSAAATIPRRYVLLLTVCIAAVVALAGLLYWGPWRSSDSAGTTFPKELPANGAAWSHAINLMPLIDLEQDCMEGQWTRENGTLVSDATKGARVRIPFQPPEEYDMRVSFSRLEGERHAALILSKSGQAFTWQLGKLHNTIFAFLHVFNPNGKNPTITRVSNALENNRRHTTVVTVRNHGFAGYLDGKLITQWKTDYKDVSMEKVFSLIDNRLLGVGSFESPTKFYSVELLEITGKGRAVPRAEIAAAGRESDKLTTGLGDVPSTAPAFAQEPSSTMLKLPASLGHDIGAPFLEIPKPQAMLMGFKVSFGKENNQTVVKSLQPIYRAGMKRFLGAEQGEVQEPTRTVEARSGYAVGGLNGTGIMCLNGFEVEFMKVEGGGLDVHHSYTSDWLGGKNNARNAVKLAATGKPVVGVFGRSDTVVRALGLVEAGSVFEPGAVEARMTSAAAWPGAVRLLPLIDPARDAVLGRWKIRDGALVCADEMQAARLQIPYEPPEEYDFRIVFTRIEGEQPVGQLFSQDDKPALWVMGHWCNSCFGFEMVKNRTANNNPLTVWTPHCLANNRVYASVLQVRKTGVRAFLDGRLVNEWKTNFNDAGRQKLWKLPNERALGLVSDRATTAFHSVDVLEITGKGKIMNILPKVVLKSVTYCGGTTRARDDGGGFHDRAHWQDKPRHRYPYFYCAGQTFGIAKASWLISGAKLEGPFLVRGNISENIKILESKALSKATDAGIEIEVVNPSTDARPFPARTRFTNMFDICWEISWDGGKSWYDAGTSSNPIHVSLDSIQP